VPLGLGWAAIKQFEAQERGSFWQGYWWQWYGNGMASPYFINLALLSGRADL
jgi:hypothetical protein